MSLLSAPAYKLRCSVRWQKRRTLSRKKHQLGMMNVASARNCVSTSHFAAATCHYCTITVCLLSLCRAQASPSNDHSRSFSIFAKKIKEKTRVSSVWNSLKNRPCEQLYTVWKMQTKLFLVCLILHEAFLLRSHAQALTSRGKKSRILCAHQHYTFESYYTRWLLTRLCLFSV